MTGGEINEEIKNLKNSKLWLDRYKGYAIEFLDYPETDYHYTEIHKKLKEIIEREKSIGDLK